MKTQTMQWSKEKFKFRKNVICKSGEMWGDILSMEQKEVTTKEVTTNRKEVKKEPFGIKN